MLGEAWAVKWRLTDANDVPVSKPASFVELHTADGSSDAIETYSESSGLQYLDEWRSPHTQGVYPAAWEIQLDEPNCLLEVHPWMADQEVNFPAVTYWEGAVRFEGTCNGAPTRGNGYIELTGYAGNLPLR